MNSEKDVTPVKTEFQRIDPHLKGLDSGFCRKDRKTYLPTFFEIILY
jgi:hypothetical protein